MGAKVNYKQWLKNYKRITQWTIIEMNTHVNTIMKAMQFIYPGTMVWPLKVKILLIYYNVFLKNWIIFHMQEVNFLLSCYNPFLFIMCIDVFDKIFFHCILIFKVLNYQYCWFYYWIFYLFLMYVCNII